MQLGMIGLGRMGANMVSRLLRGGHQCVVFDMNPAAVNALTQEGAIGASPLAELVAKLAPPRPVWLMATLSTSSKWCTTASSTVPWRPTLKGLTFSIMPMWASRGGRLTPR